MAGKRKILALNAIFLALASLATAFQCCGFLLSYLLIEKRRQQRIALQMVNQYNVAVARLKHVRRRAVCRRGRVWRIPGRTAQWWQNLYNRVLPESEWKKNLRMEKGSFHGASGRVTSFYSTRYKPTRT